LEISEIFRIFAGGMDKMKEQEATGRMTIWSLLKNILPFVLPYRWLITLTLVLTLVGSLMAQVNAVVLDRAVDAINALIQREGGFAWGEATKILMVITIVLLGKEVVGAVVTFFQRYYGERMRILVSRDLSLRVVDRILSFRMAFFTSEGNETGKLQSRIDRGIMSLSNTVNNFFIEILPLFTSAVLALGLMFAANVFVGLVALCIVPLYFWVTYVQASRMKGGRRGIFGSHQAVSQGILNILESISVIKSFNREQIEAERQAAIQRTMTDLQAELYVQRTEEFPGTDWHGAHYHLDGVPGADRLSGDVDWQDYVPRDAVCQRQRAHPTVAPHLRRHERRADLCRGLLRHP